MKLLERLNLFKRVSDLEAQEELAHARLMELIDNVEAVQTYLDARQTRLEELNMRLSQLGAKGELMDLTLKADLNVGAR
jgi:hypothetical protein